MCPFFIHLRIDLRSDRLISAWSEVSACSAPWHFDSDYTEKAFTSEVDKTGMKTYELALHLLLDASQPVEDYGTMSTFHIEQTLRSSIYGSPANQHCACQSSYSTTTLWKFYVFAEVLHDDLAGLRHTAVHSLREEACSLREMQSRDHPGHLQAERRMAHCHISYGACHAAFLYLAIRMSHFASCCTILNTKRAVVGLRLDDQRLRRSCHSAHARHLQVI